ncbi:hypothetical protein DPMN_095613 [Dreissena polymorpha]|uniref:Uncharacterized protein n=1 Tax=Dreissena polymorpha TaxID=45954 RepID=A0A9D4L7X5_DREPO|nr:hypothetical protein DPMN_095613 [Dreissena polymorpha]
MWESAEDDDDDDDDHYDDDCEYSPIKNRSHYDAGGAPLRDPGLHRESIKMFNTSGMNRESPGRPGAATGTTGTAPPRQSYGNDPVNAVRNATVIYRSSAGALPATTGVKPERCLPAVLRYTVALPAFTGAQPGHYRRQPGLCLDAAVRHRGTTGDNRGSAGASSG